MKIIKTNSEAQEKLLRGIDLVANIVKMTLGPSGKNVVFTTRGGTPTVTNDGVSIAREIQSEDEIEQVGIDLINQASMETNSKVGDGTTTSIILAQAIVHAGFDAVEKGRDVLSVRKQIQEECDIIVKKLNDSAKKTDLELLKQVARTSVENEEYGNLIAKTIVEAGEYGVVTVDYSQEVGVKAEFIDGLQVDEGLLSPYMATEGSEAIIEDAYIAICDLKLSNFKDMMPLLNKLAQEGIKKLFLVCEGMETHFLSNLVMNKIQGHFEVTAIKAPYVDKESFYQEIAAVTGAKVIGTSGLMFDTVEITDLGRCDKITCTQDKTLFAGGHGDIQSEVEKLTKIKSTLKDAYLIEKTDKKIARITGGVAVIRVGAPTEAETKYIKLKIDDAVFATIAAEKYGVVRGGGKALQEIALQQECPLLDSCICQPFIQICENAGIDNMDIPENIYDPVRVTTIALQNACSIAGTLLTTTAVIADKTEAI